MALFSDFGAIGDGTTDDTAAIGAALNSGKTIFDDGKLYKITGGIVIAVTSKIIGSPGFLLATGIPASTDIFIARPPASGNIALQWDGVSFFSESGRQGRDLIKIDIPDNTRIFSLADIRNCRFNDVNNGKSIALSNPTSYGNAMAVCNFEGNVIYRGMSLMDVGDSIWIGRNDFYGSTGDVAIHSRQVVGAQNLNIYKNTCVNTGGFLWLWRAFTPKITENVIELIGAYNGPITDGFAGLIALDGSGANDKIIHAVVHSNNIATLNNPGIFSDLRLIHNEHVQIEVNRMQCNVTNQYHVARHASQVNPNYGDQNFYQNQNFATVNKKQL